MEMQYGKNYTVTRIGEGDCFHNTIYDTYFPGTVVTPLLPKEYSLIIGCTTPECVDFPLEWDDGGWKGDFKIVSTEKAGWNEEMGEEVVGIWVAFNEVYLKED